MTKAQKLAMIHGAVKDEERMTKTIGTGLVHSIGYATLADLLRDQWNSLTV